MSPPTRFGFRRSRSAGPSDAAREDPLAEARREALDLALDRARSGRRSSRSGRGSRPRRCACLRGRACRIEQASAGRAARRAARSSRRSLGRALRGGDLLERAAEVHGRRACAHSGRRPRDRPGERPVELEDARAVAEALERPPVARRAGDRRRGAGAAAGVTSQQDGRAPRSSSSDSTGAPVRISPPSERR